MKNKIKKGMKFYCAMNLFLLIISSANTSIAATLFRYLSHPTLNDKQRHYAEVLIRDKTTANHWYIETNSDIIKEQDNSFNIVLPDHQNFIVSKVQYSIGFASMHSATGKFDESGDVILTENNNMITARIGNHRFSYMIYPLTDNIHILLLLNTEVFPQDESEEGYRNMLENSMHKSEDVSDENRIDRETGLPVSQSEQVAADCKLRVLIAYTDDLALALADPKGFAQSCVQTNNTCFSNAGVNFEIELACAFEINYAESGNSSTDKTAFRNDGDGVLDSVHLWRTYYDADLCHLLVNNLSNACGEAWTVSVSSYANAFCVTSRSCAVGNLTFPHEFGHLYGARHDLYVDPNTTPYADGHGKVVFNSYRTVMAYVNECSDNGATCARVAYFSNPAVSYLGTATGTFGISDNESAHESSRATISSHETTLFDKAFPAWSHYNGDYADVIALNNVSNASDYILYDGAEVHWRSGNSHTLLPGFWAQSGSKFSTAFDSCSTLSIAANQIDRLKKNISENVSFIQIQPNPFQTFFQVTVDLRENSSLNVSLYDSRGILISVLKDQPMSEAGLYNFSVDMSDKAEGIYFLVSRIGDEIITKKLIKIN